MFEVNVWDAKGIRQDKELKDDLCFVTLFAYEEISARLKKAESERDSTRAQLEVAREALEAIEQCTAGFGREIDFHQLNIRTVRQALAKMKEMEG